MEDKLTRIPHGLSTSLTRERYGFRHSPPEESIKLLSAGCVSGVLCKRKDTEAYKCLYVITSNFIES